MYIYIYVYIYICGLLKGKKQGTEEWEDRRRTEERQGEEIRNFLHMSDFLKNDSKKKVS